MKYGADLEMTQEVQNRLHCIGCCMDFWYFDSHCKSPFW